MPVLLGRSFQLLPICCSSLGYNIAISCLRSVPLSICRILQASTHQCILLLPLARCILVFSVPLFSVLVPGPVLASVPARVLARVPEPVSVLVPARVSVLALVLFLVSVLSPAVHSCVLHSK